MREKEFIDWIRSQGAPDAAMVPVGPGDDAAVVTCGGEQVIVTTDQLLDGVHFVLTDHGPEAAGRKAMARSLSDAAAMACRPLAAVAAVALPKGFRQADAEAIYRGLRAAGDEFRCPLAGGDVAVWAGPTAITVTVLARAAGAAPVLRSGARAGEAICVTGAFGGAWRSSRHLTFRPRIDEAVTIAAGYAPSAMIDVSDGLAADLWQVCQASGVGAELNAEAIPVHPDLAALPPGEALAAALGDGEDYELLFALHADRAGTLLRDRPFETPVARIGTVVRQRTMTLIHPDGRREPLEPRGWEHRT